MADPYSNNRLFLDTLTGLGVPEKTAMGALGSLAWESGETLRNTATNKGDGSDGSDSIGWGQWNQDRATALKSTAAQMGTVWTDPTAQAAHIKNELTGRYSNVLEALKSADDMHHGADVWTRMYENPAVKNVDQRYGRAVSIANAMGKDTGGAGDYVPPTTHTGDLYAAGGLVNAAADAPHAVDPYANDTTGLQGLGDLAMSSPTVHIAQGLFGASPVPDPSYSTSKAALGDLITDRKTGETLPPEYIGMLGSAVSADHAKALSDRAWDDYRREQRLASITGWMGGTAKIAAGFLDPASVAAAVATDGAISPITSALVKNAPRAGRIAAGALSGGISNVAITAALQASGNTPPSPAEYLYSLGTGMALGGAFGAFARHPVNERAAPDLVDAGKSLREKAALLDAEPPPEVPAPKSAADFNVGNKAAAYPANDHAQTVNPAIITAPEKDLNVGSAGVGEGLNDTARAQSFSQNFNVGQSAIAATPANDAVAHLNPADLIEEHATHTNPDLFDAATAADNRVAEIKAALDEHTSRTAPHDVQDALATLRDQFVAAKGKDKDTILSAIRKIEGEHPELIGKDLTGDAKGEDSALRQLLNEARLDRGKLGPKLKAARDASAKWLGEDPNGPLIPLGEAPKLLGKGEAPSGGRIIHELRSVNDAKPTGEAAPKPKRSAKAIRAANDILTPEQAQKGQLAVAQQAVLSGKDGRITLRADNDPRGYAAPPAGDMSGGGGSVGAARDPYVNERLFTQQGDWADVRDNGQYLSNFTVKGATKAEFALPASGTQLASSPFAEHRIAGAFLGGNPIGYKSAVNPVDAYLVMSHRLEQMNGRIEAAVKPAFKAWADEEGLGNIERNWHVRDFQRLLHDYIVEANPGATYPASIKQAGDAMRAVTEDWRKLANELKLTEQPIEADPTYLPRIGDAGAINELYNKFGIHNLATAFFKAGRGKEWAKDFTDDELMKIARGYVEGHSRRALDLNDRAAEAWAGHDFGHLRTLLMQDAKMSDKEASDIVDKLAYLANKDESGVNSPRLKHRIDWDMTTQHEVPNVGTINVRDLFIKDPVELMQQYNRHMAGRTALAETKIVDPDTGTLLVDGIRNQGDFDRMKLKMRRSIQDHYIDGLEGKGEQNLRAWQEKGEANLDFLHDRILARPLNDLSSTRLGQALRIARMYTFDRIMGATGWSHLSMYGAVLSHGGIMAMLDHSPMFKNLMQKDGKWIKDSGLMEELEAAFGNHTDPLRGLQMRDWDHSESFTPISRRGTAMGKVENVLRTTNRVTAVASGLAHVIHSSKNWAYRIEANRFAKWAHGAKEMPDGTLSLPKENMARIRQLGLSEEDLQKVLREMKDKATVGRGIFFNHKLVKLNLDNWDQEMAHKLQYAIKRTADRLVQENDAGSMNRYSASPFWQLMMQFRSFPMVGHTKQLTYNLAMHDKAALNYFAVTSAMGALIYVARQKVNSLFRDDREAYLEKMLSWHNIAHAAIYHSGWGGMAPTMVDTGLRGMGFDPWFDYRSSGQQSAIWDAPLVSSATDAFKGIQAVRKPVADWRQRSQIETKNLMRILPFNNTLPGTLLTNFLTRGQPPRPPHEAKN